jgi:phage tail-like protein
MRRRNLITGLVAAMAIAVLCIVPVYAANNSDTLDYVGNYNFTLEIDGVAAGQFTAVDGLTIEQEVIEYQNGDDPLTRKRPGRVKYGDVTLTRQYASNSVLNDWIEAARTGNGNYTRKNLSVKLLDQQGTELKRWNLFECFPVSWDLTTLDGGPGDTLYEEMVIAVEWFEEA